MVRPKAREFVEQMGLFYERSGASRMPGRVHERVPAGGSRQHHYRIRSGGWTQIVQASMATVTFVRRVAERGLELLADAPPERRARLQDFYDFMTFAQQDYGEAFLRRWEQYRRQREKESS
jgi:hypothetical protein